VRWTVGDRTRDDDGRRTGDDGRWTRVDARARVVVVVVVRDLGVARRRWKRARGVARRRWKRAMGTMGRRWTERDGDGDDGRR
jgi:hypothetical protein